MAHFQKHTYKSKRTGKVTTTWQARYTAPDGRERTKLFDRKVDAESWVKANEGDIVRGTWVDPVAGQVTLRDFANKWLEQHPDLRPTTRAKYRELFDRHVFPTLGDIPLNRISPSRVRGWQANLRRRHHATAAGAYRLLATIYNTAVTDEIIARSPCRVKGGASEVSQERPVAAVAELEAAVAACVERYRVALLLAAWCQLRRGEVLGLQRQDVDLKNAKLRVRRAWVQVAGGTAEVGDPKTDAGKRTVTIPPNVLAALQEHLERHTEPKSNAWLFDGGNGQPVSPRTLDRAWNKARMAIGREDLHLHDLRHSGLTWTAGLGATTAELMYRAGHKSPAAAIRYQHAAQDRDAMLADALGALASGTVIQIRRKEDGIVPIDDAAETPFDLPDQEQPQRDSNPCRHLERVVS